MDVSPQARTVFGLSISGEVLPNTLHNTDHSYYNVAVKDELRKWTLSKNINLSKMTAEQAGEFVNYIKNGASSNSMINGFVQKIHDFNAKVSVYNGKAGAGLAKGMMRAFFALGVADRAVQNFSTENQVCISMSWCASLTGKQ